MKNLLDFIKIFVLVAVIIFPANVLAIDYNSVSVTALNDIVGNWYDSNGNLILTISSDYKLNSCQIMSVGYTGDTAAFYKIIFKDGDQNKYIEVIHTGSYEKYSDHEMLIFNENSLRRTKNPKYFESVGGIYLGMNQNEVLKIYGEPSNKEHFDRFFTDWIWKYNNLGLEVSVYGGIVTEIKIYNYGDRKFDRSGLSAKNSISDFEKKYVNKFTRRNNLDIGHGEIISFRDNSIQFGIFTDGYVL